MNEEILTQEILKQCLDYNKETGEFFWRITTNRKKAGTRAGTQRLDGYRKIQIKKQLHFEHRLAWLYEYGNFPKNVIDHIDGNPSNNSIENLRDVTMAFNCQNRINPHQKNKLNLLGVTETPEGKFKAKIVHDGKVFRLGTFDSKEHASFVYKTTKKSLLEKSLAEAV
jgi:hypothetical protein